MKRNIDRTVIMTHSVQVIFEWSKFLSLFVHCKRVKGKKIYFVERATSNNLLICDFQLLDVISTCSKVYAQLLRANVVCDVLTAAAIIVSLIYFDGKPFITKKSSTF